MKNNKHPIYITEEIRKIPVIYLLELEMSALNRLERQINNEVRRTSLALEWIQGIKNIKKPLKTEGRMDKKTSFVLYPADFLAAVHNFKKNQVADLIIALCEINFYGDVSFKLSESVKKRFDAIQDTVEKNNAKYKEICEKRQAIG